MKDILVPLSRVYPDIDPMYLRTIIDKFYGNPNSIQDYLEANINTIPKRRDPGCPIQGDVLQLRQTQEGETLAVSPVPDLDSYQTAKGP